MIVMPISDYPASSDERAQIQVLSERKGEIRRQIENVKDSPLDKETKLHITGRLEREVEGVNAQIRRKTIEKDRKEKIEDMRQEQERLRQKEFQNKEERRNRLDVRA